MFKKAFLLLGVMSLATSAMATELTNPFYTPGKNNVSSTTGYEFNTTTANHRSDWRGKEYDHVVSEAVRYGLTDAWSLDATVSNTFEKTTVASHTDRDDKNVNFEIGSTYGIMSEGPVKVQSTVAYGQKETTHQPREHRGAYKYARVEAKAGYTYSIYTPYVSANAEIPVFQHDDANNEYKYDAKLGVYTYCPKRKLSFDTGVAVHYDEFDESRIFSYDLEADYHFTPKMALGVYGSYGFAGKSHKTDIHSNALGIRLRTAF